jgi:predicted DNA-binding transcriptional regulator AlpA
MINLESLPPDLVRKKILNAKEAANFLGFSVAHLSRQTRAGKVPACVRIGVRKRGWRLGDLLDHVDGLASHRDAA